MWGKVDAEEGAQREEELKGDFWKDIMDAGGKTERFNKSSDSAWDVIRVIADNGPGVAPLISREIVDSHHRLNETEAGITLNRELEKLIKDRKDAVHRLTQQAKKQNNGVVVRRLNEQTA